MAVRSRQWLVWTAMVLVAGCGSKKSGESDHATSGSGTPSSTAARRPYVISDAGIRFNPPASWDVARVDVVSRSGAEAATVAPGAGFLVSFDYKAEQPAHRNEALLNLYVVRKSEWSGAVNDSVPGVVIDSTGEWVFVAAMPPENPYREGLLDADQFEAMRLSLDEVRNAFSIENGGPPDATLRAESKRK